MKTLSMTLCVAVLLSASEAFAQADLKITEIYPGVAFDLGGNITEDWFEITNFGDAPWVFATDGTLFYDDESADPTTADRLDIGLTEIAAGQSVVFVNSDGVLGDGIADFLAAFPTVDPAIVGSFLGSGLGGGGDFVALFTGDSNFPLDGISNDVLLDYAGYPNQDEAVASGSVTDGSTFDVFNNQFSVEGVFGAFAGSVTTELDLDPIDPIDVGDSGDGIGDGVFVPIVGSPGLAVPEPATAGVVLTLLAGFVGRRRS